MTRSAHARGGSTTLTSVSGTRPSTNTVNGVQDDRGKNRRGLEPAAVFAIKSFSPPHPHLPRREVVDEYRGPRARHRLVRFQPVERILRIFYESPHCRPECAHLEGRGNGVPPAVLWRPLGRPPHAESVAELMPRRAAAEGEEADLRDVVRADIVPEAPEVLSPVVV